MFSKNLEKELNKQINAELFSAYLYLSMSAYLESINLTGFANWMKVQFHEEQAHAFKIFDYVLERNGNVKLTKIDTPKVDWNGIIDVFEDVYSHEQKVTGLINNLVNIASKEKDHATVAFLQWFVNEQVEEEATANDILEQLKLVEGKGSGLFMIDRELKQRVFTPIDSEN